MISKITSFHRNPYFYSFIYCFNIILSTKMAGFVLMKLHICPETSYICINVTFGEKIALQLFHHFWKKLTVLSLPVWCHPYRLLLCVHFLILYVFIISVIFCSLLMVIILQYSYWVLQQDSGQSHFFSTLQLFPALYSYLSEQKIKPQNTKPRTKPQFRTKYFRNYIIRNYITIIIVATKRKPTKPKLFYSNSLSSLMHPLLHILYYQGT